MYRATTPSIYLNFPDTVDLTEATSVVVTFCAPITAEVLLEKSDDELDITAQQIAITLTQEESLALPKGSVLVQANWLYSDGVEVKRACSNIKEIYVNANLKPEVMGD